MLIETTRHGHVLLVRMVRAAKRNAVNAELTAALSAALDELDDDPDLWCGVLTGTPEAFSAGTDLVEGPGAPTPRGGNYGVIHRERNTPLIAAVEGLAYGGGFEIALACDMVVAARDARFALPEVTHGLVANCGALFRTHRALPLHVAKQMLLTGRPLTAVRAHELGLVNELAEPGAVVDAALELAEQVVANAPIAVSASLRALERAVREGDDRGWTATRTAELAVRDTADKAEGLASFAGKREPVWRNR